MSDHSKRIFLAKYGTSKHLSSVLSDKDAPDYVKNIALKSHSLTPEQYIAHAKIPELANVRHSIVSKSGANPDILHAAVEHDSDQYVRGAAAKNPSASSKTIHLALDDKHDYVRENAIQNANATTEHVTKAINDKHPMVVLSAMLHPAYGKEHTEQILNGSNDNMKMQALIHKSPSKEQLEKLVKSDNHHISSAANAKLQQLNAKP